MHVTDLTNTETKIKKIMLDVQRNRTASPDSPGSDADQFYNALLNLINFIKAELTGDNGQVKQPGWLAIGKWITMAKLAWKLVEAAIRLYK